jgi:hypothetical protein
MDTMTQEMSMPMQGVPLGISSSREGSGTAWQPDSTPMHMAHLMAGSWTLMLHGSVFVQYIREGGDRGDAQFGSVNWIMGMARRSVAGGNLAVRSMLSAERATVGKCGYPNLLATGELCDGERLHDRQHPHDLFMELAASYEREISSNIALQIYGGPAGEPALGPVAFPHRLSAMPGSIAPITHHWLDATHISFGVMTAGLYSRRWKLEGSLFNAREPDEERYDLDLDRLDSFSGRLWIVPDAHWTLQLSFGQLNEAEQSPGSDERHDVRRTTASATYHRPLSEGGIWANTIAWGRNEEEGLTTDAFLFETNLNLRNRNVLFARAEVARKTGGDLAVDGDDPSLTDELFSVGAISLGFVRQLGTLGGIATGVGIRAGVSFVPATLEPFYGTRAPVGLALFTSIRPGAMRLSDPHAIHR